MKRTVYFIYDIVPILLRIKRRCIKVLVLLTYLNIVVISSYGLTKKHSKDILTKVKKNIKSLLIINIFLT